MPLSHASGSHLLGGSARILIAFLTAAACSAVPAHAEKWPAIEPNELHLASPSVDREADAEAMLWEIRVLDEMNLPSVHSEVRQYLRIKIFTERGRELAGRVDIPFESHTNIADLAARTIRPDGSVVEVPRKAFYERTLIKAQGRKVKAMSFAFPSVERGSLVEYRWTERRYETIAHGQQLVLQRDIPVRRTELWVRPLAVPGLQFRMRTFNMDTPHFEHGPEGFQRATLPPVEAAKEEPFMPPSSAVSPWVLFSYALSDEPAPSAFWRKFGKEVAESIEPKLRPDNAVRTKASEIANGAATDQERILRVYDFCRTRIRNLTYDPVPGGSDEPSKRSPSETLKRGQGSGGEIDLLFAAMARALGMQSRIVLTADRSRNLFDSTLVMPGFLNEWCVAVWVASGWRYYDPASRNMPAGMLPWWEEGQDGLFADIDHPHFVSLPVSPADSSRIISTGVFRLTPDGALEGQATQTYTGHASAGMKERVREQSPGERERTLREKLEKQYPGSVVDSMRIEHVEDPLEPFVCSYRIRIPGYAPGVGSRLLPALAFFQHGEEPLLKGTDRRHSLHFNYAYAMQQSVDLELPNEFEVESAPEPKPVSAPGFGRQQPTVMIAADGRKVRYLQTSWICDAGTIAFPRSQYAAIKATLDQMREQGECTVALRRVGEASSR